jgi:hypothetical protein
MHSADAVNRVCSILDCTSPETVHLVLETLRVVFKHAPADVVAAVEVNVSPTLISMWETFANDQLVSQDIVDVFRSMLLSPPCVASLRGRLTPLIGEMLNGALEDTVSGRQSERSLSGAVELAIELLRALIDNDPLASSGEPVMLPPVLLDGCFITLLRLVVHTDDHR